jgi:uncharacterized OB-fold protein
MAEMSAAMREFARRAGSGSLEMQKCAACGCVQWPPREVCRSCLSDALEWSPVLASGTLSAATTLHASMEEFFRARLPWRIGTVRLDAGPVAYAHLHQAVAEGDIVRIESHRDFKGRGVLVALPLQGGVDPKIAELISTREE